MTNTPVLLIAEADRLSDEQLVALCQRQWPSWGEAFSALMRRYRAPVYNVCLRYLRHEADADDVTQAVFVRVWRHLRGFRQRSSFRTWLYRIVRNQCHTAATERVRRSAEPIDDWVEVLPAADDDCGGEREAAADQVRRMLCRLPAVDREVLERRFLREQTLEAIAAELGIGLSAAKMRLYRAVDRVKTLVTAELAMAV